MTIEDIVVYLITHGGTFYASLLSQMKRVVDKKMVAVDDKTKQEYPTLGVTIRNGAIELHYHPDLFDSLTADQARALLEHECLHIVMDHIARRGDKDNESWNMATDLAVNQMIQGLPKNVLTLNSFPAQMRANYELSHSGGTRNPKMLYPNDAAEDYYNVLYQMTEQQKQQANESGDDNGDGPQRTRTKAQQKQQDQRMQTGKGSHDLWADADDPMIAGEVAKQAVMDAVDRSRGEVPSNIRRRVEEMTKPPKISWRRVLREFVAASIKAGTKHSWKRVNRRYGEDQKGKLPDRQVSITVVIDTSGSIGERDYNAFMSEVTSIQSCYKSDITVLECDARVGKEYKLTRYKKLDKDFSGGGGTSFKPPFEYVKKKGIRTDVLIYFTDLEGDFPSKPAYPTLWVSTNYSDRKAPFGKTVRLELTDEQKLN